MICLPINLDDYRYDGPLSHRNPIHDLIAEKLAYATDQVEPGDPMWLDEARALYEQIKFIEHDTRWQT